MKDLILKYIKKDSKEDIFHSSAYGKAQNSSSMGTASTETFSKRRELDQHRQAVRRYGESRIANNAALNGPHAKPYTPPKSSTPPSPTPGISPSIGPKY